MNLKNLIISITHIKSVTDFVVGFVTASVAAIFAYFKLLVLDNSSAFEAITWVVIIDFIVGVSLAIKNGKFETQKALKIAYYFGVYFALLGMVLKVEQGFPSAFWLSEAVMMPVLVFQVVSILKNLHLLGVINNTLLAEMLEKIDRHKNGNA
jgi:hypothetical protein